jgi:hypothetical protein
MANLLSLLCMHFVISNAVWSEARAAVTIQDFDWTTTWDQRERPTAVGKPTSIAFVTDSSSDTIKIFGWLGSIKSLQKDRCVGFGKVAAAVQPHAGASFISFKLRTDSPALKLQVTLIDLKTQAWNATHGPQRQYVKAMSATEESTDVSVVPTDFYLSERGVEVSNASPVDFQEIVQIGFQMQRSIQDFDCENKLPFLFQVSELTLRNSFMSSNKESSP